MKTERLTLLVTPDDKAAIAARASSLGLSVGELVRQATMAFDPGEAQARAEVEALLPEFSSTIGRIHESFERMIARLDESERRRDAMETPEYRDGVRRALAADASIDWARVQSIVGSEKKAA